jgi:adenylosuccinate lyase
MIARYARPAMSAIWSDTHRLEVWLEVELAVTAVRERRGEVPDGVVERLRHAVKLDPARMEAIEAEVRHDVIAFLSMVAETGGDDARHLHAGMTSSDLVDTALAKTIGGAVDLLVREIEAVEDAAWDLARRHRLTPMVGRTHGVHAEPITFGLKCLTWAGALARARHRLAAAGRECRFGKLSGAVGTLAHLDPDLEAEALATLGLAPEPVASQVVPRDRHAALGCALAVLGGVMEAIAVEIRHLQRTEVREAAEPFAAKQKGSSAMPHKRNPVRAERVSGLARLLRAYALAGLENQALWHERDISHSSVERVTLPDSFLLADFMAAELREILAGLTVDPARMRANLEAGGGLVFSQRVLLALTAAGLPRDRAYGIVQRHALAAADGGPPFREALAADTEVTARLSREELDRCFALEPFFRKVDALFARAEAGS